MKRCNVAILDDHQSTIDGYIYRLSMNSETSVVATALFGEALEPMLAEHSIDVLLLDLSVPVSVANPNTFPIMQKLPTLIARYPTLKVVVISMFSQPALIAAMNKLGVKGYIVKDDSQAILNLANIVTMVNVGGTYFSPGVVSYISSRGTGRLRLLTDRQMEALELCAAYPDLTSKALAQKMGVADSTLRNLLSEAYKRLNVRTRTSAVAEAKRLGILLEPRYDSSQ